MTDRRQFLSGGAGLALAGLAGQASAQDACGGMSREQFDVYIQRFNDNDPRFIEFYHPEVVLELGDSRITTPQGIQDFYAEVKQHIRESLEVTQFISDAGGIAAELPTRFECYRDWDDSFWGRSLREGEVLRIISFVMYRVEDGLFRHIRSARYRLIHDWRMEDR